MKKIFVITLFFPALLLIGCEKKPVKEVYVKSASKPYSTPELTIKTYIKALNENDYELLNECHHPKSKLKENTGEYEKLKDTLKDIKVTKYEFLKTTIAANGLRAQVQLNWELKVLDPKTKEERTFFDNGRVIEVEKFDQQWLVSPHNNGRLFLLPPKVSKSKVEKKEPEANDKKE